MYYPPIINIRYSVTYYTHLYVKDSVFIVYICFNGILYSNHFCLLLNITQNFKVCIILLSVVDSIIDFQIYVPWMWHYLEKSLYRCNLVKNLDMRSSSINWISLKFKDTYPRRKKKRHRDTQERKHCEDQGWDWNHASKNQELQLPQKLGEAWSRFSLSPCKEAFLPTPWFPGFQTYEGINFCCFKLHSLRWFIIANSEN